MTTVLLFVISSIYRSPTHLNLKSAGTNTRSAPRRHAPRRPCCFALLRACSFRLESERSRVCFVLPLGLGSVAPPLPPAPVPLLRNRSVSRRQLPTEAKVTITLRHNRVCVDRDAVSRQSGPLVNFCLSGCFSQIRGLA